MEFLNSEAQAHGASALNNWGDDDEDLEEETLLETPLDNVEPYQLFRNALLELQHHQPQLYEGLTKGLSPDEQNVIKGVVHEAEAKKLAAEALSALSMPINGH